MPQPEPIEEAVAQSAIDITGRIFLAVSGGLDSMVLLHAAASVLPHERLCALHVDHGLHAESAIWCRFVERQSSELGIDFVGQRVAVAEDAGLEAAAKDARFAWFARRVGVGDVLLTAHHRRDQAETVLLRLMQGRGAYGMPPQRGVGEGLLRRPLLDVGFEQLKAYQEARNITYITDPSNADVVFDRNYVRAEVLPVLAKRWPDAERHLSRAAARDDARESAGRSLVRAMVWLPVDVLPEEAGAAVNVLRWWLHRYALQPATAPLLAFVRQPEGARTIDLANGRMIEREAKIFFLPTVCSSYVVPADGCVELPHGRLTVEGIEPSELTVAFGAAGMRWSKEGRQRPVTELLRAVGVASWLRDHVPLVLRHGRLVAISGVESVVGLRVRWEPAPAYGTLWAASDIIG